jgi:hemoglobin-like flavoprotein
MNKQQIELLQRTFAKVEPVAQEAGELFYGRLFEMDPSLRPLFTGDMTMQASMVITAIGLAIQGLDHPEAVIPQLALIGQRHVNYGAMPTDFDKFGAALQWALAQTLGDDFTQPVQEAWGEAFKFITREMKAVTG